MVFFGDIKTKEKDEKASVHSRKHLLLLVDLWVLCLPQSHRQRKEEHVLHAHPNEGLGGWIYPRPSKSGNMANRGNILNFPGLYPFHFQTRSNCFNCLIPTQGAGIEAEIVQ